MANSTTSPVKDDDEQQQIHYEVFRDCVSSPIIRVAAASSSSVLLPPSSSAAKSHRLRRANKRKQRKKQEGKLGVVGVDDDGAVTDVTMVNAEAGEEEGNDALGDGEEMLEFIDYISTELFHCLPTDLRTPSSHTTDALSVSPSTLSIVLARLPPTVADSLVSYRLLPSSADLPALVTSIVESYVAAITNLATMSSRLTPTTECELCARDWIPLTYHHLIPRSTHDKVLKRGWHPEWRLNMGAWLCRACHDFVHRSAKNEELARYWWSLDLLREREDVQAWVKWVGRVRWKKR